MIEIHHLTKRYGDVVAVDDISCMVRPGSVTGFVGPNGAGKSTTMRMVLGLDAPTSGHVLVAGRRYRELDAVANILIALVVIGGQLVGTAIPSSTQRFLPFNALNATVAVERSDELLTPFVALALIAGYAAVIVAVATVMLQRRDV